MELQFYLPTRIIMGADCVLKNAGVFAGMGKKALIVTGRGSAKKNGSLSDITQALSENEQGYIVFDRVMSNPSIDCVYEGAAFAKENGADFVIAAGGGSPMDAAKAIALLSCQNIPREKLFSGQYGNERLPMVFIPTTAGTGSEVTQYAILTNDEAKTKTSLASPSLFPDVAFLDSKYMNDSPESITVNTAVDALSHAVEGFLSARATPMSDIFALQSIRILSGQFENLKKFTLSANDRSELLYASTLAGIVIAHTGTTAVHAMGYSLTYFRGVDHGRANGLLMPEFLKFVHRSKPDRVQAMLCAMGLDSLSQFSSVMDSLLGEKENLTLEEAEQYSDIAALAKNRINCIVVPEREDLFELYRTSFDIKTEG